ncbi:hypothetical protein EJV47_24500 [Hymenobacter gummosus]|uniref:NERD domain-containing protein n=1 Tax=Hymenobacter gummosus TaxID=1776032 RepID=A0A431TW34_9BACT|nr:hypothetical protein [Hymenobacter gummosus]RTQ45653.1 hypothetical protein EJV47_24500 [Hymenobacter gummosus]
MLHSFLFAPFPDSAAEAQFDALHALLQPLAEADEAPLLLLGNLPLADADSLDAVVVRPAGIVLLQFIARGGSLHIPALGHSPWQLSGQPLPGRGSSANPYTEFQRQQRALAAWLTAQPGLGPIRPEVIAGIALFAQPVTFGSEVEARLNALTGADHYQLLSSLPHLPRRLQRLQVPGAALSPAALQQWLQHLLTESAETASAAEAEDSGAEDFWTQKARQLWRWLGAEDIPPDTQYASYAPDAAAEKQRLEQVQQQVRAELDQHTQAAAAREAEREHIIRQLQQQLAAQASAAAPAAAELQARLAAETQEKEALREAVQLARAESAARNRELDARIEQLGTLIQQLQARPATPTPPGPTPAAAPPARPAAHSPAPPVARPAPRPTVRRYSAWRLQPWRAAAVVAVVIGVVLGGWGLWYLYQHRAKPAPPRREARRAPREQSAADATAPPEEAAPTPAEQQLEDRLNNPVIDSTGGAQSGPAPTDSVLAPTPGYLDADSVEDDE